MTSYNTSKDFTEKYAYDLSKNITTKGEVYDEQAINVSIDNILMTSYGERFMSPYFGSPLMSTVFENLDEGSAEQLMDDLIEAILRWEDRITIIKDQIFLKVLREENTLILVLPYVINVNGFQGKYSKKIVV